MKRYLVCTLLVINAAPIRAAQASWCKDWPGCGAFTSVTDAFGITEAYQAEQAEKKRLKEAEAARIQEETKAKIKQKELDNVPTSAQIEKMTEDLLSNNTKRVAELKEKYDREDAAIQKLDTQDTQALVALLQACKDGSQAKCAERRAMLDVIYERSVRSNDSATQQGALTTDLATLTADLKKAKDQIVDLYKKFDTLREEEHKELTAQADKRYKAKKLCAEGQACNDVVDGIDEAVKEYKESMQKKNRDVKQELDAAWKNYVAIKDQLNDLRDPNEIEREFDAKYSVAKNIWWNHATNAGATRSVVIENAQVSDTNSNDTSKGNATANDASDTRAQSPATGSAEGSETKSQVIVKKDTASANNNEQQNSAASSSSDVNTGKQDVQELKEEKQSDTADKDSKEGTSKNDDNKDAEGQKEESKDKESAQ